MLRSLTLSAALAALAIAGAATAQPTGTPAVAAQPPVNQSPPVSTDTADPATQDDSQAPSSTSAMPAMGAAPTTETPPAGGAMQRPSGTPMAGATAATAMPAAPAAQPFRSPSPAANVYANLLASGQFTQLTAALQATNLRQVLETQPNVTVFAPTDAAFAALPEAQRTALMGESVEARQQLQQLLLLHVVNTRVTSQQLTGRGGSVPTIGQVSVPVNGTSQPITVGGAPIIQADVPSSNGVIHAVGGIVSASAAPAPATTPAPTPAASPDSATPADDATPDDEPAAATPAAPATPPNG